MFWKQGNHLFNLSKYDNIELHNDEIRLHVNSTSIIIKFDSIKDAQDEFINVQYLIKKYLIKKYLA